MRGWDEYWLPPQEKVYEKRCFLERSVLMEYFPGLWLLLWRTTMKAALTDATFVHKFREVSQIKKG